jgi:hypothetical protein
MIRDLTDVERLIRTDFDSKRIANVRAGGIVYTVILVVARSRDRGQVAGEKMSGKQG